MQLIFALCIATLLTFANLHGAVAASTTSLDMQADRIHYYSNRFILSAEGRVRLRLSDGTRVRGEFFVMDLKLNRFLMAGNVQIDSTSVHEIGAAFAGYLDLDRSYFLPATGSYEKWTYVGLDFAHPLKGREQPSDAYFIPDVSGDKPYIVAGGAEIIPRTLVRFTGSRIYVLGVYVPTVSWVETFSANPNYSQNAFAGASFDIGLPYQGSLHAVSAVHLRYTGLDKLFLSFDQHFVWGRDYLVFSINPVTNDERQFNLIGYKRISPKIEARVFLQESSFQYGIYRPIFASAYENLQSTLSYKHSAFTLTGDNYNTALETYPPGPLDNEVAYNHPSDAQVAWAYQDTKVGRSIPLYLRFRGGYGNAHDGYNCGIIAPCPDNGYVLSYFGMDRTPVPTIWQHFVGFTAYTPSISLDKRNSINANLVFDDQRQWFSLPHHIDTQTLTASISKLYTSKLAVLAAYNVTQLGDYYGARQLEFYPPDLVTVNNGGGNVAYPGFQAFRGFSTTRFLTGSVVATPNQFINYAFTVRRGYDFPAPIPGVFGNPPWQVTNEIRFRVARHILVDATRTDYFNWGGYEPSFNLQFGP